MQTRQHDCPGPFNESRHFSTLWKLRFHINPLLITTVEHFSGTIKCLLRSHSSVTKDSDQVMRDTLSLDILAVSTELDLLTCSFLYDMMSFWLLGVREISRVFGLLTSKSRRSQPF